MWHYYSDIYHILRDYSKENWPNIRLDTKHGRVDISLARGQYRVICAIFLWQISFSLTHWSRHVNLHLKHKALENATFYHPRDIGIVKWNNYISMRSCDIHNTLYERSKRICQESRGGIPVYELLKQNAANMITKIKAANFLLAEIILYFTFPVLTVTKMHIQISTYMKPSTVETESWLLNTLDLYIWIKWYTYMHLYLHRNENSPYL